MLRREYISVESDIMCNGNRLILLLLQQMHESTAERLPGFDADTGPRPNKNSKWLECVVLPRPTSPRILCYF